MKYIYYLSIVLFFAACQQEDSLEASGDIMNYFKASETDTDEESVLRRAFEQSTGCYVLFNDTLFKEQIGTDADGFPMYRYEAIDLGYGVLTSNKDKYSFTYLTAIDTKKKAVEFIEERILPVMEKELYPYSFLLVDSIYQTTFLVEEDAIIGVFGTRTYQNFYSGTRSFALSAGGLLKKDEAEQKEAVKEMFSDIIRTRLSASASLLTDFYAYDMEYYGGEFEIDWDIDYIEDMRELGFLSGNIRYGYAYCPAQSEDLEDFIDAVCNEDEDSFVSENEDYPIVIAKYRLLKNIVLEMGYHIEKLN